MTKDETLKMALDFLMTRRMGAEAVIEALNEALAQPPLPMQEFVAYDYHTKYDRGCYKCRSQFCPGNCIYTTPPPPGQEPTPWRDMVVVSLVREGINKHKARELADHFAAQPVQEPLEQLRPAEFIQLTKGKEAVTGIPAYCWSEWLNKEQP